VGPVNAGGASFVGGRRIEGSGTAERDWQSWPGLAALAPLGLDELASPSARVVVVAPHPDDEVLACGGMLALLARDGRRVRVIGVTDGEASHPGSARWTPRLLARRRREERERGLALLGVAAPQGELLALGLQDGGVPAAEARLESLLREHIAPGDVVFTTWRHDGHPDHEATGRATVAAAAAQGARCWEMPVWAWHWARPDDPRVPWAGMRRLALDADARGRKGRAIAAHGTQLATSPGDDRPPVLPDWALARLLRPFEFFMAGEPLS
jgi:LmbE family N-acetylglucosaminyl deacetylase